MADVDAALEAVRTTHDAYLAARQSAERQQRAAQELRDQAIRRAHAAGASYRRIAEILGVAHNYVYEICTKEK